MPKKLTAEEAEKYGITVNHELMESGELRFRLMANDGSVYARIAAPNFGTWQNSHYHSTLSELYIVQKGWIVFAEYDKKKNTCKFKKVNQGENCSSSLNIPHNVYLSAGCIHHCIKHGDLRINDWLPSAELDKLTKNLSEDDLLNRLK